MEVGWRKFLTECCDFKFLLNVFKCCFEFLLNVFEYCFEFLLNVVIFPEQARNLCQNCEKYFTIPLCHKKEKAAAHSGGGRFLSSSVVIIVIGFKVKTREFLRVGFCCSACRVEVSRNAVIVIECLSVKSVKVYHSVLPPFRFF